MSDRTIMLTEAQAAALLELIDAVGPLVVLARRALGKLPAVTGTPAVSREALANVLREAQGAWFRTHSNGEAMNDSVYAAMGDAARAALGLPPAPDAAQEGEQPWLTGRSR